MSAIEHEAPLAPADLPGSAPVRVSAIRRGATGLTDWFDEVGPWLRELYHIVFWVGLAAIVVTILDQGRDVMRGLVEDFNYIAGRPWFGADAPNDGALGRVIAFWAACMWSGIVAWYWGNLLLVTKTGLDARKQPRVIRWLRRLIGGAPIVAAMIALWIVGENRLEDIWLGLLVLGVTLFLLVALFSARAQFVDNSREGKQPRFWWLSPVWLIRRLVAKIKGTAVHAKPPWWLGRSQLIPWLIGDDKTRTPGDKDKERTLGDDVFVVVLLLVALFMLHLLQSDWRIEIAWSLGPAALAFGAVGCLIPIISMVIWLSRRAHFPAVLIFLALFFLTEACVDNHAVRALAPVDATRSPNDPRPTLDTALEVWLAAQATDPQQANADEPLRMALVATAGGASRAAYWTGAVLEALDRQSDNRFSQRLFAISSISGGTLGAVGYAGVTAIGPVTDTGPRQFKALRQLLGADFLAPAVGGLLYTDLVQRFVPFKWFDSRATVLEEGFELAALDALGPLGGFMADDYQAIWAAHWPKDGGAIVPQRWVPIVFSGGAHVETGKRIVTSPIKPTMVTDASVGPQVWLRDGFDFYDLHDATIRASTAISNSARFPLVSPAGTLEKNGQPRGHIVDGGYFENSGIATLNDLLREIEGWRVRRHKERKLEITLILIENDPPLRVARNGAAAGTNPPFSACDLSADDENDFSQPVGEATFIVEALLQARVANGELAKKRLEDRARVSGEPFKLNKPITIALPRLRRNNREQGVSMSWALSPGSRDAIDAMFATDRQTLNALVDARFGNEPRQGRAKRYFQFLLGAVCSAGEARGETDKALKELGILNIMLGYSLNNPAQAAGCLSSSPKTSATPAIKG